MPHSRRLYPPVEPGGMMSRPVSLSTRPLVDPEAAIGGSKKSSHATDTIIRGRSHERHDKVDRVLETRNEHVADNTREQISADREGVIDLTNDESSMSIRGLDPDAADSKCTNLAEESTEIERNSKVSTPSLEVRSTKVRDKSDVAAIELKRKRLKDRLNSSKERMEKRKIKLVEMETRRRSLKISEKRGKALNSNNSLLLGESGSTQRDPPASAGQLHKKSQSEESLPSAEKFERKTGITDLKAIGRKTSADLNREGGLVRTGGKISPSDIIGGALNAENCTQSAVAEKFEAIEVIPHEVDNDAIEVAKDADSVSGEDHVNAGCSWYLCSGATKESTNLCSGGAKDFEQQMESNDGRVVEPNPAAASKPSSTIGSVDKAISTQEPSSKFLDQVQHYVNKFSPKAIPEADIASPQPRVWETLKSWIDPAPTLLMNRLKEAEDEKYDEDGSETVTTNNSVRRDIPSDSVIPEIDILPNAGIHTPPNDDIQSPLNQSRAVVDDANGTASLFHPDDSLGETCDTTDEQDQDSGMVSDAGLNSMPTLEVSQETILPKGVHQTLASAFEPVKPVCISPAASLEHVTAEINNDEQHEDYDDSSSVDASTTNMFGDDLLSVPSVKDDVTEGVSDLHADDLGNSVHHTDSPSIDEKMETLKMKEALQLESTHAYKETANVTLEARRQTLVKDLRSAIATFGRYDIRCANITAALGDVLDEGGDHVHAVRLHKDAAMTYSSKLGDDHTTTLNAKMRLGAVLENANQYDEAINTFYLVTVMRRALNGENDPTVADGLVKMAHVLRKKSDFLQAIKELKRALKIYRASLGDAHEKVACTVDQIASLYVTVGDFDKSAAILEEVVKLKAATIGTSSRAVANTLTTLATTYECSEKFSSAMKVLKKAYKIYTEIGGYSSEDSTATLNRIAQLYEATGDQNRASIAYLGVLRARKILRGADSLSVGETYFRLGHSLRETGQFHKALQCLKEALPIFVGQGVEMNDMKMVADIMHEMAFINQDQGNYQEAVRIFRQELSVRRKIGQPEFPLVARTLNHLGVAEFELQNNSRALKYLVEALTIFQERGEQGVECAEVLFNTGLVFDAVLNKERSLEAYTEAARLFRSHGYSDEHPHLKKAIEKIEKATKGKKS